MSKKNIVEIINEWDPPEDFDVKRFKEPPISLTDIAISIIEILPTFNKSQRSDLHEYLFGAKVPSQKEILNSAGFMNTMLFIENAKRSLCIKDFIATYAHIRLSAESFSHIVLQYSKVTIEEEVDDQFSRLKVIEDNSLLSTNELKILHSIRRRGNNALHKGVADADVARYFLEQFQIIVQTWVDKKGEST